jgi:hypothetical protein
MLSVSPAFGCRPRESRIATLTALGDSRNTGQRYVRVPTLASIWCCATSILRLAACLDPGAPAYIIHRSCPVDYQLPLIFIDSRSSTTISRLISTSCTFLKPSLLGPTLLRYLSLLRCRRKSGIACTNTCSSAKIKSYSTTRMLSMSHAKTNGKVPIPNRKYY